MVALAALTACLLPSDSSGKLRIDVRGVPAMFFVGDRVIVSASVVDASGAEIPNENVRFTTDNDAALEIRPLTGRQAEFLAHLSQQVTVRATAISYSLPPVAFTVNINPGVSIDSITPSQGRWGDEIVAYGAGLDSLNLIHFHVDGIPTHPMSFEGLSPRPDRYGRVMVVIPAGAHPDSPTEAIAQSGSANGPRVTVTAQEDRYEPNEAAPSDLGTLPELYHNPGLALERRVRGDARPAIDWYRFTNTTTQDRTIRLMGAATGGTGFIVNNATGQTAFFWDGSGESTVCSGVAQGSPHPVGDTLTVALKDLPAGTYDIEIDYERRNQDRPYELMIMPEYMSMMDADAAEGNDYCEAATSVTVGAAARPLTIDRPNDDDWFRFTVPAGGLNLRFLVQFADSNDLDLEILRSFLPDSAVFVAASFSADENAEDYTVSLPPGNYLLHVSSFLALPVDYTLSITAVPAAGTAAVAGTGRRENAWREKARRRVR